MVDKGIGRYSIPGCLCKQVLIGASLSEPHINGYELRYIYIYIWYVGPSLVMPRPMPVIPDSVCMLF